MLSANFGKFQRQVPPWDDPSSSMHRQIEAMLTAVMDHGSEGIFVVAVQTSPQPQFWLLMANDQATRVLELSTATDVGMALQRCLEVDRFEGLVAALEVCLEKGEPLQVGYEEASKIGLEAESGPLAEALPGVQLNLIPIAEGGALSCGQAAPATIATDASPITFILGLCQSQTVLPSPESHTEQATDWLSNQQQLQRLISDLPGIIFTGASNSHWSMQYLSQGCLAITGYSPTELVSSGGQTYNEITHPEDLPRLLTTIATAIAQQQPYEVEYRIRTKAGGEKWLWEKGNGVFDQHRQVIGIEGFITDITPLKQAEAALIQSEARWRSLIQYSFDLISILAVDGTMLYHSPALTYLLGYQPEQLTGLNGFALVHPEDLPQVEAVFAEVLLTSDTPFSVEYRLRHRDGSWRFLLSTGSNRLADPTIAGVVLNTRDITDRKQAEEKYRSIFENAVEGIFQTSPEGRFINANPALARIYGYDSPQELLTSLTDIAQQLYTDPQRRTEFVQLMQGCKTLSDFESQVYRKDGAIIWIAEHARAALNGEGELLYYEGTVEDITERKLAEIQLIQTTSELRAIFQALPDLYFRLDQDGKILDFKAGRLSDLYLSPPEFLGQRMVAILPEAVGNLFAAAIARLQSGEERVDIEYSLMMPNGCQTYEARLLPLLDTQMIVVIRNISDRKQTEQELRQAEEKYRSIFENATEGIFQSSLAGFYISANPALAKIYGYDSPADLQGSLTDIGRQLYVDPDRRPTFVRLMLAAGSVSDFESQVYCKDGQIIWISENARVVRDSQGEILYFEGTVEDITERKQAEATIYYQAFHDLLTGLPNRVLFDDRLGQALAQAQRNQEMLAVLFLDLDRFKVINDTLGHTVGDHLLQQVAYRLLDSLRQEDTIARWGGDEFTILIPRISCLEDSITVAERVLQDLKPAFYLQNQVLHITASLGIALFPEDGEDTATLLRNADTALYRAKEQRNSYCFYTTTLNSQASELLTLENHLHQALERQELVLHYQPLINTKTGEIERVEALIRWKHPQLGLVPPSMFIALAEENGLILPIGEWVLSTACQQCRQWQQQGFLDLGIAVNLSARQFQQPHLVKLIHQILTEVDLQPQYLELEVTETTAMGNVDFTRTMLSQLAQMGVAIALDDFGSGYSSLNYLKQFPLHTIKIDRTFIRDLPQSAQDRAIAAAVIALSQGLDLKVVAEGVETQLQLEILRSLGCNLIQGYRFSLPLNSHEMTELMHRCPRSPNGRPSFVV